MRLEKKRTVGRLEVKEYVIRGQFYTEQELTDDYVHAYLGTITFGPIVGNAEHLAVLGRASPPLLHAETWSASISSNS
jgi:hypothetical protein